jgi:hypothetical protein
MSAAARILAVAFVVLLGLPATLHAQRLNRVDREGVHFLLYGGQHDAILRNLAWLVGDWLTEGDTSQPRSRSGCTRLPVRQPSTGVRFIELSGEWAAFLDRTAGDSD